MHAIKLLGASIRLRPLNGSGTSGIEDLATDSLPLATQGGR
jgi:hypothetical protein